jgi:glycosyltransferase involved in cell wall biosynthesis
MIGGGPQEAQVRAEADAHGFGGQVVFAGRKTAGQVARYMQAADLLCLTSENEGVPNVVLEAFASGRRVVSTEVGGISEVLDHDLLGQLVASAHFEELAAAMARVLAEPPQVEKILRHAGRFTWEGATEACRKILLKAGG